MIVCTLNITLTIVINQKYQWRKPWVLSYRYCSEGGSASLNPQYACIIRLALFHEGKQRLNLELSLLKSNRHSPQVVDESVTDSHYVLYDNERSFLTSCSEAPEVASWLNFKMRYCTVTLSGQCWIPQTASGCPIGAHFFPWSANKMISRVWRLVCLVYFANQF